MFSLRIGRTRQLPNPENCSLDELQLAISCCPDKKAIKRLNAIHLLLCGATFELTRAHNHISERCLQEWIRRFNSLGIDGITYRPRQGRPRKLSPEAVNQTILPLVDDPSLAGESHWTAVKLCGWLRQNRDLDLSYPTLVRYLHEQNYARRIPRPMPEPPDRDRWIQQREDFADELLDLLNDPKTITFFGDEAGFEGDPRPRQRWVKRGSRPTQGYYGGHIRKNVVGAVNPADGKLVSLIVPHNDTVVFQTFLDTMAQEVPKKKGSRVVLVLDNASWHKSKSLHWHHIEPIYLPPYSPDFNPIERLWQHLKSHYLAGFITKDGEELSDKLCESIQDLLAKPDILRSVCRTHTP